MTVKEIKVELDKLGIQHNSKMKKAELLKLLNTKGEKIDGLKNALIHPKGQTVFYIRVSTVVQNTGRQEESAKEVKASKVFTDKASGKSTDRPELQKAIEYVREGDTFVVHELSRLARNTQDLLNIVDTLEKKGVAFKSVKENIDTSTPTGKLLLTMLGAIATFERDVLLERQREGIALAKQEGKYKGRKKIEYPENWKEVYDLYKIREVTGVQACKKLGLKKTTFFKLIKDYKQEIQR